MRPCTLNVSARPHSLSFKLRVVHTYPTTVPLCFTINYFLTHTSNNSLKTSGKLDMQLADFVCINTRILVIIVMLIYQL